MTNILISTITFFSGIVQSVTGFGCGIVMMIFFPDIMGMISGAAVSATTSISLTSSVAFKFRKHVNFRILVFPLAIYVTACTITINRLKGMNVDLLEILFGVFLILVSVYLLLIAKNAHFKFSIPVIILFAAFSGITSGLFSIGGPLMALYFLHTTKDNDEYKGTSQCFFFFTGITGFVNRILNGIITISLIPAIVFGIIGISFGTIVGLKISSKLNTELTKVLVYSFVGVSGIIILLQKLI